MDEKLLKAARSGDVHMCQELLKMGAHIEAQDIYVWTPLITAASYGHLDVCLTLLEHGAHIEAVDKDGLTPLIAAARNGNLDVCLALLERGAHIEASDEDGWTPLITAANNGHLDVCLALLERGADIDESDIDGRTPLIAAAYYGHMDVCLALLAHGARSQGIVCEDANIAQALTMTPLQAAAALGQAPVLMKVINADPEHHTLPERVKEAVALAEQKDKFEAVAVMQSWLAQQAIHDLVKPVLSEKVIR